METLRIADKYRANCGYSSDAVFSYGTKVATINHEARTVTPLGWWSVTTSKHINYIAKVLGYAVVKR